MSIVAVEPQLAQIATILATLLVLAVASELAEARGIMVVVVGVAIVIAGIFSLLLRLVF